MAFRLFGGWVQDVDRLEERVECNFECLIKDLGDEALEEAARGGLDTGVGVYFY